MRRFIVITPTFNRPEQLKRCLDSLIAQNYSKWQVIVMNDGSSADYSTLGEYWQHPQIEYLPQVKNCGVNRVRNIALAAVKAESNDYVCFVDDDEYLIPEAFSIADNLLEKNPQPWLVLQCFLNNNQTT